MQLFGQGAEIKSLGREGYGEGEPFSNGFPPRNSFYRKNPVSGEEATAWPDCTAPCPARKAERPASTA